MSTMIADDAAAIRKRMEEIRAERLQFILGRPLEEAEAPKAWPQFSVEDYAG
jgi:hypothetical protein